MWPLATLAASLRTDTSPPDKGGLFIGTPHSPSALALRSRPPHSPLNPHPPNPFCCASALALRARPPHSPSALAHKTGRFSPGACPARPDITAAHCCHLGGRSPASPRCLRHPALKLWRCYTTRGLPCPRTPAALRGVGSASAACASSRYSRCGMTLRAPVAFSFRHPALCLWRCYAQGFAAPRAPLRAPRGATRRVGLALIVPPSALALVFYYFACRPLALHHRY